MSPYAHTVRKARFPGHFDRKLGLPFHVRYPQCYQRGRVNSLHCCVGRITGGPLVLHRTEGIMQDRALYSIQESRRLLGGISRNTIYRLLRSGELPSVVIGCRRFIAAHSIEEIIGSATSRFCPAIDAVQLRNLRQKVAILPPPIPAQRRAADSGRPAVLSPTSHQSRKPRAPT